MNDRYDAALMAANWLAMGDAPTDGRPLLLLLKEPLSPDGLVHFGAQPALQIVVGWAVDGELGVPLWQCGICAKITDQDYGFAMPYPVSVEPIGWMELPTIS